ncbi:MAG: hypothetical protein WBG92_06460 [Thiohalocapsa sp.]
MARAETTFTGDAPTDFAGADFVIDGSGFFDVGVPFQVPAASGWDINVLYFDYDRSTDTASFGLDFFGVAGDADGDGQQGSASDALAARGGQDLPNLADREGIAVGFDVDHDGMFDFAVGVPALETVPLNCGAALDFACFGLYDVDNQGIGEPLPTYVAPLIERFLARRPNAVIPGPMPNEAQPDLEFAIPGWTALLNESGVVLDPCEPWSIDVQAYAGSYDDDGIGEDYMPSSFGPGPLLSFSMVALDFPVLDPDLCACQADPEACACRENPELCSCELDLDASQDDLNACRTDLNACEESLSGHVGDSDADGTPDAMDQCPQTVSSAGTDLLGCSKTQFCANFGGKGWRARLYCEAADWKNDEPIAARDCHMRGNGCVPRESRRGSRH